MAMEVMNQGHPLAEVHITTATSKRKKRNSSRMVDVATAAAYRLRIII
jgi:hypothetical protein